MFLPSRLSVVFRWRFRLGSFPACWRQANVTPISKGPPSSSVANCRPVSKPSVFSKVFERPVSVCHGRFWNAVVCFQPPSLLIGNGWVPVMHCYACRIHCKVHWRVVMRLGSCGLISVLHLIGSIISEFCISSVLWVLEVLCVYIDSFYQFDHRILWWMVVEVNYLGVPLCSVLDP